jgi:hypothetical protein
MVMAIKSPPQQTSSSETTYSDSGGINNGFAALLAKPCQLMTHQIIFPI